MIKHRTMRMVYRTLWLVAALIGGPVAANGPIGEHVNDLAGHLDRYENEVNWLIEQVGGIVDRYEAEGQEAAQPELVVDHWEAVDFHAAIETNYVPLYASIWQGLFGVRVAVEEAQPVATVRAELTSLEQTLWQSLGAVKMAAQIQAQGGTATISDADALSPSATIEAIKHSLDRVVAKHAERLSGEAKAIVFDAYLTRFEGLEGDLIEVDADLVEALELDFNVTLPQALDGGASVDDVREIVLAMQAKLETARGMLAAVAEQRSSVF